MAEITSQSGRGRDFGVLLFVLWGLAGFALSVFAALGATPLIAITVSLVWIGGMLFFGILALLAKVTLVFSGAVPVVGANTYEPIARDR